MKHFILLAALTALLAPGCTIKYQPLSLVASGPLAYPEEAREAGVDIGSVLVSYDVDTSGTVSNVQVVESEPEGYFEDEALTHVKSWRFRPAHLEGQPIEQKGVVSEISFRLEDEVDVEALVENLPIPSP